HIGLHVEVSLKGMTVGGALYESDELVAGVVVGLGALGDSVTIKLDSPIGGGERGGLLHRESHGQDMVAIDDPARVRCELPDPGSAALPDEVVQLIAAGKKKKAILRYRELTGATLDEALAAVGQP
ncbi:MAG TPA: hypothetical protein VL977_06650, partial [Solirubrobacteraceae bacterium]|nr:hypothetical protein [Solirubrobacteraceae bacterium]